MQRGGLKIGLSLVAVAVVCFAPHHASAATTVPPLLITELQTGTTAAASEEFIELYNPGATAVDLTGWQLWYLAATADSADHPTTRLALSGSIAAGGYALLSGSSAYLPTANLTYDATLAMDGGAVRLMAPTDVSCQLAVADGLAWGTSLYAEGQVASAPAAGSSLERMATAEGMYSDSDNNSADFAVSTTPTPGVRNASAAAAASASTVPLPTVTDSGCLPPSAPAPTEPQPGMGGEQPTAPVSNEGLSPPQISELLPNPAAPQTDAANEFIELYNPNDTAFDASDYQLRTKQTYTLPPGTQLPAHGYTAFSIATTGLTLANDGGQATLLDLSGAAVSQTQAYTQAPAGQAWALQNGAWQWTTTSTPNAANTITTPPPKAETPVAAITAAAAAANPKTTTAPKAAAPKTAVTTKTATSTPKAVKAATTTKPKAAPKKSATTATTLSEPKTSPLHPAVLALAASFALLYAGYEYRNDLANKFFQLRANRATRRAAGQSTKGR